MQVYILICSMLWPSNIEIREWIPPQHTTVESCKKAMYEAVDSIPPAWHIEHVCICREFTFEVVEE